MVYAIMLAMGELFWMENDGEFIGFFFLGKLGMILLYSSCIIVTILLAAIRHICMKALPLTTLTTW